MYDQPAVANPIETQKAHQRFKKQLKAFGIGAGVLVVTGGLYWYISSADSLKAEGPELKGLHMSAEENERKVKKAQKE